MAKRLPDILRRTSAEWRPAAPPRARARVDRCPFHPARFDSKLVRKTVSYDSAEAGAEEAGGEVILRFDAHAEMPAGYVRACLMALAEEEAANVGGWREARGEGPWGHAVAGGLRSPLGGGDARLLRRPPPREGR